MERPNALRSCLTALFLGGTALTFGSGCLEEGKPVLEELDNAPPTLVRTAPPSGAPIQIAPRDALVLIFSEPLDPLSLRGSIKAVKAATVDLVPLRVAVEAEDPADAPLPVRGDVEFLVEIRAENEGGFDPNSSYQLILTTGLSDTEGNALAEEVVIDFSTGA